MSNVSGIIKSIQDIMRKDVGVDGDAQRISQLVWMFFLKMGLRVRVWVISDLFKHTGKDFEPKILLIS